MKKMTKLLLQSISPPFFGNNFQRHMTPIRRRRPLSLHDGVTPMTTRSGSKQTRLFSCGHRDYFMHSTFEIYEDLWKKTHMIGVVSWPYLWKKTPILAMAK
ncbi:hypothetical protein ACP275_08G223400 [Erythranthe tilingii]